MRGIGCYSDFSKNSKGGGRRRTPVVLESGNNLGSGGRTAGTPRLAEGAMEPAMLAVRPLAWLDTKVS